MKQMKPRCEKCLRRTCATPHTASTKSSPRPITDRTAKAIKFEAQNVGNTARHLQRQNSKWKYTAFTFQTAFTDPHAASMHKMSWEAKTAHWKAHANTSMYIHTYEYVHITHSLGVASHFLTYARSTCNIEHWTLTRNVCQWKCRM